MHYPSFYNPASARDYLYIPNARNLVLEASGYRKHVEVKAAMNDGPRTLLLIIDAQKDFGHKEGSLYVAGRSGEGAIDDSRRIAEFIYRELGGITSIIPTLDTHLTFQVFTPVFWLDQDGQSLLPHDMIDGEMQIMRGGKPSGIRARVNPHMVNLVFKGKVTYEWLQKQMAFYCHELVARGKPMLYIWPEHCQLGSVGHTLVGVVHEAILFHSYVRDSQNKPVTKGDDPLSECYSVFGAEITESFDNTDPIATKNISFYEHVCSYDRVIVAGQALSHCVRSSVDDLLLYMKLKNPGFIGSTYLLSDCCSAVVVPGVVDYTDEANNALTRYREAGMNVVTSTEPMASWLKR